MDAPRVEELDSLAALEERIQNAAELVTQLRREIQTLRAQREQVRERIEKLLAQMDLLNTT